MGIRVERAEMKDVSLPDSMKRSMSRQAEAERERRARIITADGEYQASKRLAMAANVMVWGSETRFGVPCGHSGGDVVLVGESAEDLLPADPELGEVDRFRRPGVSLSRGELAEGTVRPGSVIVPQVLGQRSSQVVLIDD